MDNYDNLTVEELVVASRGHDDSAFAELVKRYTPLMNKAISGFLDKGLSEDDLFCEATVALHTATLRYDLEQKSVTFGLFARICVHHRLIDLFRRDQTRPELVEFDVNELSAEDELVEGLATKERALQLLSDAQRVLSDYEYRVLLLHIQGYKTSAIAEELSKNSKSVDNAKLRIFRRLREHFGKGEN